MQMISAEMQSCVENCLNCYETCIKTSMHHCLEAGGKHVAPQHFRLMSTCAEICRAAAAVMLIGTSHHRNLCRVCAEVCEDCGQDCERIGDMQECVEACRRCAETCRSMSA
ncbi:four-helix bundle copper-binding protein [Dongia soli]|uniref:Four-helix bundle copper-binding protein n=1 Tax=Dongia soli TaxID=600628 RepID=A0ABU5EFM3_9PROT|nr:four-helix bundle copper-binding protein [Dongia soli]MDY0884707.1 four-helix bundle copper-binding protein [Dongia soli]